MNNFMLRYFGLFIYSAILLCVLSYSLKMIYSSIPNDFNRHIVILNSLQNGKSTERIICFGDSRAMSGVNTEIIKNKMGFNGDILNLSSTAQTLYEAAYLYSMVGKNTKTIIQLVSSSFFCKNLKTTLSDNKAISLSLSGYILDVQTKKLIPEYNPIFNNPQIYNCFESRSILKNSIHNILRPILDNEKFNEKARNSITYPHLFTEEKQPNYFKIVKKNCQIFTYNEKPSSQLEFLKRIHDYFVQQNINYLIVFMPINPDQCDSFLDTTRDLKAMIESETKIAVLDLSSILNSGDFFYDAGHPNNKGAMLISRKIADYLKDASSFSIITNP
jgi:hypothetical protein